MRIPIFLIIAAILVISVCSCHKAGNSTAGIQVPWELDSLPEIKNNTTSSGGDPIIDDLPLLSTDGVMMVCEMTGQLKDTSGTTNNFFRRWEMAQFRDGRSFVNAGDLTLNWTEIPFLPDYNAYYIHHDSSVLTWNEGATNHWQISGPGAATIVAADLPGTLPTFTGSLPPIVSLDHDLTLTFNTSNTANGDLAYIVVFNAGHRYISAPVSANGGTARISVADIKNLTNSTMPFPMQVNYPPVPPLYFGGFMGVVVFSHIDQKAGGKTYSFVRQRVYLGNVNFAHSI